MPVASRVHNKGVAGYTDMGEPTFNLFTRNGCGKPVWLEAIPDLKNARHRLSQLASVTPGEYFVFSLKTQKAAVSLMSSSEQVPGQLTSNEP
jgi:hypothetical protein